MKARLRLTAGNTLLSCMVLLAAPCGAQDPAVMPALYSSPEFQEGVMRKVGKQALAAGQRSVVRERDAATAVGVESPPSVNAELQFKVSDGISRTLRTQIADLFVGADPVQAAEYRSALVSDQLWHQFEGLLRGSGFSSRNLADVMASYYIGSWQIVHQVVAPPDSCRAVRDRLAMSLEKSPEIILMSDPEKQRSAEALGIMTAVADQGSQTLLRQNDQIGYIALQNAVYQSLLKQGIDLKHLRLDNSGFVPG